MTKLNYRTLICNTEHTTNGCGKCPHARENRTNIGQFPKEMKEAKYKGSLLFCADSHSRFLEIDHQTTKVKRRRRMDVMRVVIP